MQKDFNIKIAVRNARLLRLVRERYDTNADFCRVAGIDPHRFSGLLNMKISPYTSDGCLKKVAEKIVSALGVLPDEIWPAHISRLKAKKTSIEIEMDAPEFLAIASSDPEKTAIYRNAISKWSQILNDREKDALCARMAGRELSDIGKDMGIGRERVRQIEVKALRKMKLAAVRDGFRSATEFLES
jgi:DNA-binding CsgD family transcriptional regulator